MLRNELYLYAFKGVKINKNAVRDALIIFERLILIMIHKSIFNKLSEYKGNPISEYNKISKFAKTRKCISDYNFYQLFEIKFQICKLLRSYYASFYDCIDEYTREFEQYQNSFFETLENEIQLKLLDSFLSYCEILLCLFCVTLHSYSNKNYYLNSNICDQFLDIIKTSLKSMNYKIEIFDAKIGNIKIIKDNPEAECVAKQSPKNIRQAIIDYMGSKDSNLKEKEQNLHTLIDLLEPTLKKYENDVIIGKVKEYTQLIRHPEVKKEEKQYAWFYKDKSSYFDSIFSMCIFIQEYNLTKITIKDFEDSKKVQQKELKDGQTNEGQKQL